METSGPYPLVVLGAGPAGATFAAHAGSLGMPVLLLDAHAFPRDKILKVCRNLLHVFANSGRR